jgi:predicted RNA-binding Zn-ribbon protein involved in translation (DUF1610 family)
MSKEREQHYSPCKEPSGHREHLCVLMERGMSAEVAARSQNPQFQCRNCGAYADARQDLCRPTPLR